MCGEDELGMPSVGSLALKQADGFLYKKRMKAEVEFVDN